MNGTRGWRLAPGFEVCARAGTPEAEAVSSVFGAFEVEAAGASPSITTIAAGEALRVRWNDLPLFTCAAAALAPALEASLIGWVVRSRGGALPLHAAAVGWGGRALVLVGDKGSGKSTLSAQLGARTDYLGDELTRIRHDDLLVDPFPKAATIKAGAFDVLPPARTWDDPVRGPVRYHAPARASLVARPVGALVWPRYDASRRDAAVAPLPPGDVALRLVRGAFGGLGREPRTLATIARLATLPGYELAFPGVDAARAALEEALGPP